MTKILLFLGTVLLVAYVVYMGWLYYAGSCQQIRDFPIPTQVPNRCIKL